MVRPHIVQGVSLRGVRGVQVFLRELCVCIKYLSLGDPARAAGPMLPARHKQQERFA